MKRPLLTVHLNKIKHNARTLINRCRQNNITVTAITKCISGMRAIAQTFVDEGAPAIGDSRVQNLQHFDTIDCDKWLIRIPMISEAADVVRYTTHSLNSELATMAALSAAAVKADRTHKILLMTDVGDLREGYFNKDRFLQDAEKAHKLPNLQIAGIATNLCCVSGVLPSIKTYERLEQFNKTYVQAFGNTPHYVSGGATSSYPMLLEGTLPGFINNLRVGELLLFGEDTSNHRSFDDYYQDAFTLEGEIVELKEKPSLPVGDIGLDAYGNQPTFVDRGIRKRAILAFGRQDVGVDYLKPFDEGITLIGASSDHTVLDVTDSALNYRVGDVIRFQANYQAVLHLTTSAYVDKIIL